MTEQFGNGFEGLEDRTLLAANVTAVLSGGTLTITGATLGAFVNDNIDVSGDGMTGHVTVNANLNSLAGNGTVVAAGIRNFVGVTNIVVNTGAGNDDLNVSNINILGNLTANLGAGDRKSVV